MKKNFFFLLVALMAGFTMAKAESLTVNDGTTTNGNIPFEGFNCDANYMHSQFIIPASQLTAMVGKEITSMQFYQQSAVTGKTPTNQWTIRLMEVSGTTVSSFQNVSSAKLVYTGTFPWTTATPSLTFDNNFAYAGGDLLIDFQYNNSKGSWASLSFYGVSATGAAIEGYSSTSSIVAGQKGFLPKITFSYEAPASCKKTTAISITNITDATATISWDAVDGAESYDVKVGATTYSAVSGTSKEVTGLSASTSYEVSVITNCGGGEQSAEKTASFRTECGAISSFPWVEDFESYTASTMADCWDKSASTSTDASSTNCWGVYSYGGNKMIRMDNYDVHGPTALINSPIISLPAGEDYLLTFDCSHKASCGAMEIKISVDGGAFTSVKSISKGSDAATPMQSNPGAFSPVEISLSAYAGHNIRIQFYTVANYGSGAIYVDNVTVKLAPSCVKPTALSAGSITKTSAELSWTAGKSETSWEMQYREAGAADWTAVAGQVSKPYSLTGLTAGTVYEVQVRAYCDAENQSDWSDKYQFTTECGDLVIGKVYTFEADAAGAAPTCWSTYRKTTSGTLPIVKANGYTPYAHEGANSLYLYYAYSYGSACWAVMPKVADDVDVSTLEVSGYAIYTTDYNALKVGVMTDPADITTFQECGYQFPIQNSIASATRSSVKLDKITNGGKYIAFYLNTSNKTAYLDEIQVIKLLEKPTNIQVTPGEDNATVVFDQVNPKGKWEYQLGDATPVEITAQTFTLTGLTAGENYTLKIRHIDEANEEVSGWTETTVSTTCVAKALPYVQDFAGGVLPACWTAIGAPTYNNTLYMGSTCGAVMPELDYASVSGVNGAMLLWKQVSGSKGYQVVALANANDNIASATVLAEFTTATNNKTIELYLADYATTLAAKPFIGFYAPETGSYVSLDDITVRAAGLRKPTNLQVADITDESATVTFDQTDADGNGWTYELATASSFSGAISATVSAQSIALTGLNMATTYYVRVRQTNDAVDHWSDAVSFTTECAKLKLNTVYDFESAANGSMPACWSETHYSNSYKATVSTTDAHAGDKSLYFYCYGSSYYYETAAMPVADDATEISSLNVNFYAKANSTGYELKVGVMTDPTDYNTFVECGKVSVKMGWNEHTISLDNYTGAGKYIAFCISGATSYDYFKIYVDDITIIPVACKAAKPAVSNITDNGAVLASGLEDIAWAYKMSETGAETSVAANATATLSGLTADTEYTIYVQSVCNASDKGEWKTITFRTTCAPAVALGYTEDFNESTQYPSCMDKVGTISIASYNGVSSNGAQFNSDAIMILPPFVSTTDWSGLMLSFDAKAAREMNMNIIACDADGSNAVVLTSAIMGENWGAAEVYLSDIADINTKLAGKRLALDPAGTYYSYVDNIAIKATSTFRTPTNLALTASSETAEGADFTFTQTGTATNAWVYEVSTSSSFTSIAKTDNISATSFTIEGLNMKTKYYVRVKQMNGAESSSWSNVVEFTTECGTFKMGEVDNLDAYAAQSGSDPQGWATHVPNCWTAGNDGNYNVYQYAFIYNNSSKAHSGNNTLYLKCRYASYSNKKTWMALPEINPSDINNVKINFWACQNAGSYKLEVGLMSDPTNMNTYIKIGEVQPTTTMAEYTISVADHDGGEDLSFHKYVVFMNNATSGVFYIDDIKVVDKPVVEISGAVCFGTDYENTDKGINLSWNTEIEPKLTTGTAVAGGTEVVFDIEKPEAIYHLTLLAREEVEPRTISDAVITEGETYYFDGIDDEGNPKTYEFTEASTADEPHAALELDENGCERLVLIVLTVNPAPTATIRENLTPGKMGTFCYGYSLTNIEGATFFEPSAFDGTYIYFDEVTELTAGYGYVFIAEETAISAKKLGSVEVTTAVSAAEAGNHMQGVLGSTANLPEGTDYCGLANGHWQYFGTNNKMTAGHAYIVLAGLSSEPAAPAPNRRRITVSSTGATVTTGIEFSDNDVMAVKVLQNGNLYIIRDSKMYNAEGQLVK